MRPSICILLPILLLWGILVLPAMAHAPLSTGDNEDLSLATVIPDPLKSWAIYSELHTGGEAQYYRFAIGKGNRIHISLFTTTSAEDATFQPTLVLMGPDLAGQGSVPDYVEIPPGAAILAVAATRAPRATYEGFAPSAFIELADIDLEAPATGTYYVAVHDPARGGNYGLAIGERESFTISEWLLTPISLLSVYQWERQSLPVILAPAILTMVVGLFLIHRQQRANKSLDLIGWVGSVTGLLFFGTGATVFTQMVFALSQSSPDSFVVVTTIFFIVPIILSLVTLQFVFRHSYQWGLRSRISLVILGILGLVTWAGFVLGPILLFAVAILPSKGKLSKQSNRGAV